MTYLNTSWIERVRNTRSHAKQLILHSAELCESAKILIETASDLCGMANRRLGRNVLPLGKRKGPKPS